MSDILRPFVSSPNKSLDRPYVPFLPAIQEGKINLDALNIRGLDDPLGVVLSSGHVPQQNDAGVVDVGGGEIIAVDHVRLLNVGLHHALIGPSSKDSVDKRSGSIRDEGLLAVTYQDGRVRYVGGVLDVAKNPWKASRLGVSQLAGRLAVIQFGLDSLDYEAVDMEAETGVVKTRLRRNYW